MDNEVNPNVWIFIGTLLEPFYLLPIGFLFLAIGIILVLAVSLMSFFRNSKKTEK